MPISLDVRPQAARPLLGRLRLDGERMAGWQLAHRCIECTGLAEHATRQMGGHRHFVQRVRDIGRGEDRFHGAGEDEPSPVQRIVERSDADVVPGTKQGALARVPHGEGIVAEQAARAVSAPAPVGSEDQIVVTDGGAFVVWYVQRGAQRRPVIEPGIRGERKTGVTSEIQQRFGPAFFRPRRTDSKADGALRPRRSVGVPIGEGRQ